MKAETPYIHLHQRKRTWTPVEVSAGQLLSGGEEVIQRALALRCLEIPVGDFISDAMKGDLPDCLLYTSPSPRDATLSRMPSSA